MSFTKKAWKDDPDHSTPITAAALVDLETRLSDYTDAAAPIPKSLIGAKGDLIVGSAADTAIRKGVGTDGQVLTADSGADGGVGWATPAGGGGSTAPTEILVIGSVDIPFLNGWTQAGGGEPQPRIYKQGGRVWMTGVMKAPGGQNTAFVVPAGYGLDPVDGDTAAPPSNGTPDFVVGDVDLGFPVTKNWNSVVAVEMFNAGTTPPQVQVNPAPANGDIINLDGVSWPLPA